LVPKGQLLVCDMSSNMASRPIDWSRFDVVYAGAQKNLGPAGCCVSFIRRELLKNKPRKDTPSLCDWPLFDKSANTFFNTPSCYTIYMIGLNAAFMLEQGGIPKMEEMANQRSKMLYDYIDSTEGYFSNGVVKRYRSRMNIPFRIKNDEVLEKKFIATAATANLRELAGHKTVGGCRASLYNAMSVEGVEALIAFMKNFRIEN
jgi:phosphoserine aminotransferase